MIRDSSRAKRSLIAPYFATSTTETLFHVVSWMPFVPGDTQQINRKRHIGNDAVHVVWSEEQRKYNPKTIRTKLTEVVIVIYPLARSLCRVEIWKRDQDGKAPLQVGSLCQCFDFGSISSVTKQC